GLVLRADALRLLTGGVLFRPLRRGPPSQLLVGLSRLHAARWLVLFGRGTPGTSRASRRALLHRRTALTVRVALRIHRRSTRDQCNSRRRNQETIHHISSPHIVGLARANNVMRGCRVPRAMIGRSVSFFSLFRNKAPQ